MNKKRIVFVGSHLSDKRGTKGISEKISILLRDKYEVVLVSRYENLALRSMDIIWTLLSSRFDIVHIDVFSNKAFYYADIASRIAKAKKERLIMTLRGGMLHEEYERYPSRMKKVFERADILQSPSLFLIDFFKRKGFNVNYMPNFIEIDRFNYNRDNVHPNTILWVRAFAEIYQPELAVRTIGKLVTKYPDIKLTMIGPDHGLLPGIEKLIIELELDDHVEVVGRIPNEELYRYYQTHAVYLNTTRYESFGMAVIEAAACGIPVVSTNVGEIPYIWNDNENILLSRADDEDMAQKVDILLSDPYLAASISKNARKKAETFSWEHIKAKWMRLLDGKES
ncbi:glycosyltransferase family 4 protein [Nitratifractor salsuginis]|uniref:Glycosyl transferase group 1 n=1 Tax=Nitratifractor salsuginis (strain DSM 16511 / JCM 12458 / E9I37-1) TaxID=749222 RepID=E6X1A2_NITSE|nr:glycosyltransferase family 4 protein [Nitratifractor salsuginis]ADV46964.1 glycosyl transferase group 1 [Nitratifractor salsuginis DSM 16511]